MNGLFNAHSRHARTILGRFKEEPHIRILKVLPKKPTSWEQIKKIGKDYPKAISIGIKTGTSSGSLTDNPHYAGDMT